MSTESGQDSFLSETEFADAWWMIELSRHPYFIDETPPTFVPPIPTARIHNTIYADELKETHWDKDADFKFVIVAHVGSSRSTQFSIGSLLSLVNTNGILNALLTPIREISFHPFFTEIRAAR